MAGRPTKSPRLSNVTLYGLAQYISLVEKTCASDFKKLTLEIGKAELDPLGRQPEYTEFNKLAAQQLQRFIIDCFSKSHAAYDAYLERQERRREKYLANQEADGLYSGLATQAEQDFFSLWNSVYKSEIPEPRRIVPNKIRAIIQTVVPKCFGNNKDLLQKEIEKNKMAYGPKHWDRYLEDLCQTYQQN